MATEESERKSAQAAAQIAAILVVAEQLGAVVEQLRRIATALEAQVARTNDTIQPPRGGK